MNINASTWGRMNYQNYSTNISNTNQGTLTLTIIYMLGTMELGICHSQNHGE